jgi:hypothetical protein
MLEVLGREHKGLAEALVAIGETKQCTHGRGKGHRSVAECGKLNHKHVGMAPARAAHGSYLKGVKNLDNHWQTIKEFLRKVENLGMEFMHPAVMRGLQAAKKLGQWPTILGEGGIWAGLSTGRNVYLEVHQDHDFFLSMTLVVPASGEWKPQYEEEVTHFFCFPKQGRSVAMRPLDLILFDATEPHCISSGKTDGDFFCISFYLSTLLVGKNNNSLPLTEMEKFILDSL